MTKIKNDRCLRLKHAVSSLGRASFKFLAECQQLVVFLITIHILVLRKGTLFIYSIAQGHLRDFCKGARKEQHQQTLIRQRWWWSSTISHRINKHLKPKASPKPSPTHRGYHYCHSVQATEGCIHN